MNTVERVKAICKERGIALTRMERDLGFANGYIGQLKKGTIPADRLGLIADYLGVTMESLMGIEPKPNTLPPTMMADHVFIEHILMLFILPEDSRGFIYDCIESQYEKLQKRDAVPSVS